MINFLETGGKPYLSEIEVRTMHHDIFCSMCGEHADECECERKGLKEDE